MLDLHPVTEARLARLARDPLAEVHAATARTAHDLAARLDSEWETRTAAARQVDAIRARLEAAERGDPAELLVAVRAAQDVLAEVSASLAPEGVPRG